KAAKATKAAKPARAAKATKATKATATTRVAKNARSSGGAPWREGWPTLSSPTKKLFPDIGATKQDVWDYYAAVMDHLLPEIIGRPLSVIRCPSGAGKPCFFQKHHTAGLERVSSVRLKEESGTSAYHPLVEDEASLTGLVQANALESRPWGSHADAPDSADRVVFALDPAPDVPFSEVKRAALDVRRRLQELELESFLRVTGGKGL